LPEQWGKTSAPLHSLIKVSKGRKGILKINGNVMLQLRLNLLSHGYAYAYGYSQPAWLSRCELYCSILENWYHIIPAKLIQYDILKVLNVLEHRENQSIERFLTHVPLLSFHVLIETEPEALFIKSSENVRSVGDVAGVVTVVNDVADATDATVTLQGIYHHLTGGVKAPTRLSSLTRWTGSTRLTTRRTPQRTSTTTPSREEADTEGHYENEMHHRRNFRSYLICQTLNKITVFYCNINVYDRIAVHKGGELYAPPAKPEEHSVFKLSIKSQGGTICSIHQNLNYLGKNESKIKSKIKSKNRNNISDDVKRHFKSINIMYHFLDCWHKSVLCGIRLLHDIELNPGPASVVKIISLNC
jgi:hypothetical protein